MQSAPFRCAKVLIVTLIFMTLSGRDARMGTPRRCADGGPPVPLGVAGLCGRLPDATMPAQSFRYPWRPLNPDLPHH